MANYHLTMKPIERSVGRSATAAAAYRSAQKITDERTGEIFDYTRKQRVVSSDLFVPAGCEEMDGPKFWNAVEKKHKRGDAVTAREVEVSLPHELSESERKRLAHDFARELSAHYQVGVEASIHLPSPDGNNRNHHCHILLSACAVTPDGLGNKVAALDPIHCKRHKIELPAEHWRKRWADLTNERLAENGIDARIDHRSLKDQGITRAPQPHYGPAAIGYERRTGLDSDVRTRADEKAAAKLEENKRLLAEIQAAQKNLAILRTEQNAAEDELMTAERIDLVVKMRAKETDQEKAAAPENLARQANIEKPAGINDQVEKAAPLTPAEPPSKEISGAETENSAAEIPAADIADGESDIDHQDDDPDQPADGTIPGI